MTKLLDRVFEAAEVQRRYVSGEIDRDEAHNEFVRAGLLDIQAADVLDEIDRALIAQGEK